MTTENNKQEEWEKEPFAILMTSFQKEGVRTLLAQSRKEVLEEVREKIEGILVTADEHGHEDRRRHPEFTATAVLEEIKEWAEKQQFVDSTQS